jgi:hypothetical protein
MATTTGHRLILDPMGKCSNAFFSETTNMIKAKLYMNVHWMVPLYNDLKNQRLSRACIVHLVIKKNNWSYVKTMSCSGSHLGITINIKNTKFVKEGRGFV